MLTRVLKFGCYGLDVEAWAAGAYVYLGEFDSLKEFRKQPRKRRRFFGNGKRQLAKRCAAKALLPRHGVVGPKLDAAMAKAYDPKSRRLFAEYAESRKPKLIEPKQGWGSLHPSLWKAYSLGRRYGFHDLGTWNPDSTLPGGGVSDHAVGPPAFAFDLGIDPDTGWNHVKARAYFLRIRLLREVEYVILGDKIWSRGALRAYRSGGHLDHLHCSGRR